MRTTLSRTPRTLDDALYVASCFAFSARDGSRTVTILCAVVGDEEFYDVEDGRVGVQRDEITGVEWEPIYYLERAREEKGR